MNLTFKKLSLGLLSGVLCSSLILPCYAQQGLVISESVVEDAIRQMDIMTGDTSGDMKFQSPVTRAEFATMLVAASPYKNVTSSFGYTLFPDVPSTYWATGYIKLVVEQGYMVGYLDGTFGPNRPVLLEEAVTAVLNLLGYNSSTLSGTYPQAQLAKFFELDLDEFITVKQGEEITRENCMYLFYNLMNTKTLEGTPYASTMGYATSSTGSLDTIALTNSNTQGPFMVGTGTLPNYLNNVTKIYRNNKESTVSEMAHYDICYYNEKLSTVWIYAEKVTGRLTSINSQQSPTSVTVAGNTYELETTDVIHKFSIGGEYREGDMVTLLLGNYDKVSDVIPAAVTDSTVIGVVLGRGYSQVTGENSGDLFQSNYIQMITTEGDLFEFDSGDKYYEAGRLVEVTYANGVQTSRGIVTTTIEGKVNSNYTLLGNHKLAEDIQIFEISDSSTSYQTVYPSRLAGYYIEKEDVRYYSTNNLGEIDILILQDTTGDLAVYNFLSKVTEVSSGMTLLGQYTYLHHGTANLAVVDNQVFKVKRGGALFSYEDGDLDKIENLTEREVSYLNALQVNSNGRIFTLADDLQVYELYKNTYQYVNISDVNDLDRYTLTAYVDMDLFSAGGQVRIILAEEK